MPKITKAKDVARSTEAKKEARGEGNIQFIKFPKGKTPFYICDENYHEGYFHYVDDAEGKTKKVLCAGGIEAKGFAPEDCAICAALGELRSLNDKSLKQLIVDADASYSANFIVAAGSLVMERRGDKKVLVPDFEDREVGVTSFSHAQFELLKDSAPLEELVDRVIVIKREMTTGNITYLGSEFIPSKKPSDCPAEPEEWEEIDLEEIYSLDSDLVEELADHLMSLASKPKRKIGAGDPPKGKAVKRGRPAPEDDDDEDEEEEEAPKKKKPVGKPIRSASAIKKGAPGKKKAKPDTDDWDDDDADSSDDDFEDDIPY